MKKNIHLFHAHELIMNDKKGNRTICMIDTFTYAQRRMYIYARQIFIS